MTLESNYDIKSLTTPAATGGTVTTVGNYRIHTFTSSGTFTVSKSMTVEVLAVAGGGGGAVGNDCSAGAGGGGSGEAIVNFPLAVNPATYTITVGNGGASGTPWSGGTCSNGFKGEDTTITIGGTTYVTVEGGYGGLLTATGGKGGGVTGGVGGTGWGSPLSGSSGTWSGYRLGGSGGGGTTGGNMNGYSGGGGPNTTNGRYSGGGGAGYYGNGGAAGFNCAGSGAANSGSGGGGANHNGGAGCAVGGSGIAIIRYLSSEDVTATNMTVTPRETPCRTGICIIDVSVTWTNNNPTSTSSFTPAITASTGTVSTQPSQNLAAGTSITLPFTVLGATVGTCSICPSPN